MEMSREKNGEEKERKKERKAQCFFHQNERLFYLVVDVVELCRGGIEGIPYIRLFHDVGSMLAFADTYTYSFDVMTFSCSGSFTFQEAPNGGEVRDMI